MPPSLASSRTPGAFPLFLSDAIAAKADTLTTPPRWARTGISVGARDTNVPLFSA
jgi:hypothetical protein